MTDRPATLAREYYRRTDAKAYDALAELLAPDFVHYRPDRTLRGRDRFLAFTRDERPLTDTTHVVDGVYDVGPGDSADEESAGDGAGHNGPSDEPAVGDVAVRGRLLDADDTTLFAFLDVFTVHGGRVRRIETYARSDADAKEN